MERLSGAQNIDHAPSVPGTTCWSGEARSRIRMLVPIASVALKASRLPSDAADGHDRSGVLPGDLVRAGVNMNNRGEIVGASVGAPGRAFASGLV
jgi:hypothetical protein